MNARQQQEIKAASDMSIKDTLKAQRSSYLDEGEASASTRIDQNYRAIDALVRHSETFSEAMNEDFSCRPRQINIVTAIQQKDLPFGGVVPSSMGAYHSIEGFKTFSHAKSVYRPTNRFNVAKLAGLLPPYANTTEKSNRANIKR
jgi:acyl-CoA reductase-like NAD-dependent aldehyde dehydrogenase